LKGILLGLAITVVVLSCAQGPRPSNGLEYRIEKMNEITQLWTQIREWRGEAKMPLDPAITTLNEYREKSVKDAQRVCTENHKVPKPCEDTCTLSGHICTNAELICKIADDLGKHDRAQEKCTSAKASCREAKKKCCDCSSKPPVVEPAPEPR
jgi:hypothetical protein